MRGPLAIPGRDTTAFLLLRLAPGEPAEVVELRYDGILGAVERGEVPPASSSTRAASPTRSTASCRSPTWASGGRRETGLPVPLAGDLRPRATSTTRPRAAEDAIRASVEYAFAHPEASRDYVRAHAQELSDEVCAPHIALYVNEFSVDLGDDGLGAIDALLARRSALG